MVTVASSTNMPTDNAKPPSVIILMVCPAKYKQTTEVSKAKGIVMITIRALLKSLKKTNTIKPVNTAPNKPSNNKLFSEFIT